MSVRSRTSVAESAEGRRQQLAQPVVLVRAAVPMAKTAGMAARDGVRTATVWVGPRVNGARAWTAPHIERGGLVIKDTFAPRIYEVLSATARRVDVAAPRADVTASRRTWPKMMTATVMLVGAGAAAAIVLRRRKHDQTGRVPGKAAGPPIARDGQPHADTGGRSSTGEDTSRQSPAT